MVSNSGNDDAPSRDLVRRHDRPRYYASLFAPSEHRGALFALFALKAEITRIPTLVSEPGLGEIRLQWWRETLERIAAGEAAETPHFAALGVVMARYRLPVAALAALIDAHRGDLYADPPATLGDLEGFFGETESALFQLACLVLGEKRGASGAMTAEAAGHAGIAYGLALRLGGLARDLARGRCIVPAAILAAHGLSAGAMFSAPAPEAAADVVAALVDKAESHLETALGAANDLPSELKPAFLPLAVVRPLISRIRAAGSSVMATPVAVSDFKLLTRMTAAAIRPLRAGRLR
ncbi:MAG TPA: squalene/phytoene synthase family protein [Afifellaceae bacterium]|nr:squalene/phytoene synthase family protein [Afifellaceae bacterium]